MRLSVHPSVCPKASFLQKLPDPSSQELAPPGMGSGHLGDVGSGGTGLGASHKATHPRLARHLPPRQIKSFPLTIDTVTLMMGKADMYQFGSCGWKTIARRWSPVLRNGGELGACFLGQEGARDGDHRALGVLGQKGNEITCPEHLWLL